MYSRKPERKRPPSRQIIRWEDKIIWNLKEVDCGCLEILPRMACLFLETMNLNKKTGKLNLWFWLLLIYKGKYIICP